MREMILSAAMLLLCSGCTNWADKVYSANCSRTAGTSPDTPEHAHCMEALRQTDRREAQGDLLGALAMGAAVGAAASSSQAQPASPSFRQAPLSGQTTSGWQRYCTYVTPAGTVQTVLPLGHPCPASYVY